MNPTAVVNIFILSFLYSNQLQGQEIPPEIHTAEKNWEAIISSGNKSAYQALLADEFTWTYINGSTINKQEAINRLQPWVVTESSKAIHLYGSTAIVNGIATLTIQGRPLKERFVRIWVRNNEGKWKVALFQATEIQ